MKLKRFGLALVFAFSSATSALAYCSQPSFSSDAPDPPGSYDKPDVPYCLSGYSFSSKHTCSSWELESYKQDVSDYIDKLNDYLREASNFASEANSYVSEVESYAKCEAEDTLSQHE